MKSIKSIAASLFILTLSTVIAFAQDEPKVIITGVRFSYPLVQKWIDDYKIANPGANIQIESRTTTDPAQYDLLIEAYEPEATIKETREYLYIAKYALLPVANSKSDFAKVYSTKGLTTELIKQIYFNDIYADKKKDEKIDVNYTIYTRLQKAGAPITFSKYFGYQQSNIKGKAIAGADEHLVKALLKDTVGISYNIPGLLYDLQTRKPLPGLTVIPVDADGNGRVSNDEKFYDNLEVVLQKLEEGELKNIPVEYLHLSIRKHNTNPEALKFLKWVLYNGRESLSQYGFLKPDAKRFEAEKEKFEEMAFNSKK